MPRGVPRNGVRISRKTGLPIGKSQAALTMLSQAVAPSVVNTMTDEEIRTKLERRFSAMDVMTKATVFGDSRALIISGPAGLGKSYGVERVLEDAEARGKNPVTIKGYIRPTGLYKTLYENRFSKSVIVFDDADSIFADDVALNLLKAACDTTEVRRLSWLAETRMEDEDGERLPRSFEFHGKIIFITNYDFGDMIARGNRLAPHFEAMISRSHYLDLGMKSRRDYFIRIQQVLEHGMLEDFSEKDKAELLGFIEDNMETIRELSLRMVIKLGDYMKADRKGWKNLAEIMCLKG